MLIHVPVPAWQIVVPGVILWDIAIIWLIRRWTRPDAAGRRRKPAEDVVHVHRELW
jgi:hypothetical protein